jgi:hypothetical protein
VIGAEVDAREILGRGVAKPDLYGQFGRIEKGTGCRNGARWWRRAEEVAVVGWAEPERARLPIVSNQIALGEADGPVAAGDLDRVPVGGAGAPGEAQEGNSDYQRLGFQ